MEYGPFSIADFIKLTEDTCKLQLCQCLFTEMRPVQMQVQATEIGKLVDAGYITKNTRYMKQKAGEKITCTKRNIAT